MFNPWFMCHCLRIIHATLVVAMSILVIDFLHECFVAPFVRVLITPHFVLDLSSYWQWIRISGWSVLDMHDCLTIEPLIIALRQCLCIQLLNHAATFVMHAWILVTERSAKPNEPEQSWIKVEITTPRLVVSHVFDYRLMDRQSHLQDSRTKPKLSKAVHQVSACHRRWSWEHASH